MINLQPWVIRPFRRSCSSSSTAFMCDLYGDPSPVQRGYGIEGSSFKKLVESSVSLACSVAALIAGCKRNIPVYAGETNAKQLPAWKAGGTSPCMRGKHCRKRAGRFYSTEHPRVCGGNKWCGACGASGLGTSPCMRGKRLWGCGGQVYNAEHPRVCGGNCRVLCRGDEATGTSPCMRGKRCGRGCPHRRLIGTSPCMRGKPCGQPCLPLALPEHPRVCGGNPRLEDTTSLPNGTSPCMRGKLVERYVNETSGIGTSPCMRGKRSK